ncbi:hypothetical protein ACFPT7_23280 [Acidicapsa dinghuensis]|uniref:Uncharacterized protein n=1 Tax=Acidicapsa dinghuensis TaxID=2218256 RepID=A0ABW1EN76_9BACT|nr:hypothetical protein [Acidicapsa dinghuensis]
MQRKGWGMLALTLLAGFAVNALSQSTQKSQDAFVSHPYTAKLTTTNVQTLANGVTMKHVFQKIEAVDSQGRRIMIMTSVATGRDPARTSYFLTDRQTKTSTQWAVPGKIITIREMPSGNGCWSSEDATVVSPQPSSESSEIAGGAAPAPVSMTERTPQTGLKEDSIREDLGTCDLSGGCPFDLDRRSWL